MKNRRLVTSSGLGRNLRRAAAANTSGDLDRFGRPTTGTASFAMMRISKQPSAISTTTRSRPVLQKHRPTGHGGVPASRDERHWSAALPAKTWQIDIWRELGKHG